MATVGIHERVYKRKWGNESRFICTYRHQKTVKHIKSCKTMNEAEAVRKRFMEDNPDLFNIASDEQKRLAAKRELSVMIYLRSKMTVQPWNKDFTWTT